MNKRFLAMLMALAMLVSMVPTTAFAAPCYHTNGTTFVSNGDATHYEACNDCGVSVGFSNALKCSWYDFNSDGICDSCHYNFRADSCAHKAGKTIRCNNDGTHSFFCAQCKGNEEVVNCDFTGDGMCECGAMCVHTNKTPKTTDATCKVQGASWEECDTCGREFNYTLTGFGPCNYENGYCTVCGAEDPDYVKPCDHSETVLSSNDGNGTHNLICANCQKVIEGPFDCDFSDGECECGAPCPHTTTEPKSTESDCKTPGESWNECTVCGNTVGEVTKLPLSEEHGKTNPVDNGDKAVHDLVCEICQNTVETEAHEFSTGICVCGVECPHENRVHHNIPSTCTEAGKEWDECVVCNATLNEQDLKLAEHTFEKEGPTCDNCDEPNRDYCWHEDTEFLPIGEGHHIEVCKKCQDKIGEPIECDDEDRDGICNSCGGDVPHEEPECTHKLMHVKNNNDGTHTITCDDCDWEETAKHEFVNGACKTQGCGALFVCTHEDVEYVPTEAGFHDMECTTCYKRFGFVFQCKNTDEDFDGICDKCGYQYMVVEPECTHKLMHVKNNNDGTHTITCDDCDWEETAKHEFVNGACKTQGCGALFVCTHEDVEYVPTEAGFHDMECTTCYKRFGFVFQCKNTDEDFDGICDKCGYQYMVVEPECEHEWKGVSYKDAATHNIVCRDCLDVLGTESHLFVNGANCDCGAIYVPDHECTMDELVSISKTQHQFQCECGELVGVPMNHYDADGDRFCDGCGDEVYPAVEECEHEWKGVSYKDAATHTVTCRDCLEVLGVESHLFVNGANCACGAIYVADHECTMDELVSISKTQHQFKCECGEFVGVPMNHYDADGDRFCDGCDEEMYEAVEECKHEWKGVILMDEAHHEIVCRDCQEVLGIESHKYVDGRPCACGAIYVEDECEHEWKGLVNNGADHDVVCRDCQEVLSTEAHKYAANGICACGAICQHEWKGLVNKGADHDVVCRDCLTVLGAEAHDYTLMGTCACGAIKPAHDCTFEAGVTSNGDGSHKVNCECGNFVTVTCLDNDGDGKCDSCGYEKYTHKCTYEAGITSNHNGTHNVNCECGKFVTIICLDNDGDRKCDSCGYVKYAHECTYEAGITSNHNGTHNVNCECGKFVTVTCLDNDGDRMCDSCGYEKYPAVEDKPVVDKPVVDYTDYDNVPKTGDILAMILAFFGF